MRTIISPLHDPYGQMLNWFEKHQPFISANKIRWCVAHTQDTQTEFVTKLSEAGCTLLVGGSFGESKIVGLNKAIQMGSDSFMMCDFDKVLHWIEDEPQEFLDTLTKEFNEDYVIIGRSPEIFNKYPQSWVVMEGVANKHISAILGKNVDVMAVVCIFNLKAAKALLLQLHEPGWGASTEWPLAAYRSDLSIGYITPAGLTWEDPQKMASEVSKYPSFDEWKRVNFDSLDEWIKRTSCLLDQLRAIKKLQH